MADSKVTQLTESTSPASTDLVYVVANPAGTPADRKVKLSNLLTAIGAQPLDSDLIAIAALTTTSYGRALLALADAAALRSAAGLGTAAVVNTGTSGANVPTITQADARYQALDSDLTAIAALSTTSYGRAFLALADAAAARTAIDAQQAGTSVALVLASGDTTGVADKAAIEAALALGGAVLEAGETYYAANLDLPTTLWHFDGRMATIKLPNSSAAGAHVLRTTGFATLTATGSTDGMTRSTIANLIIDGNKANNASGGKGLALYGWAYNVVNVIAQNCHSDGLYTEWGADRGGTDVDTAMESLFLNIRCLNNDGNGWTFRGPHDSMIDGVVCKGNVGWGFVAESVSSSNGAGAHARNINCWNNTAGGIDIKVAFTGYDIAASATGTGILIDTGAGVCQLANFIATGAIALEVKSQFHRLMGVLANSAIGLKINGANGCKITATATSCTNLVTLTSDAGGNDIEIYDGSGSGTYTGPKSASSRVDTYDNATGVWTHRPALLKVHYVGAASEPAFTNSWTNFSPNDHESVRFFKDSDGVVHLEGAVAGGTLSTAIFTLPTGFRPQWTQYRTGYESGGGLALIAIANTGVVTVVSSNNTYIHLMGEFLSEPA